ncbi:chromosome segregation protein SMC [Nioella nitratireducens]|uniref:chromosome segregation protein SMC n=1 Tax=Nioella nitratireducens TaxID=1287720 RepID=UPI0008FD50B2|nr:chromosome segregation protein SMC [Nioella nitratireducens]
MQFSRLRLNGFKSFVDPTDLVIADGLTGVVGPNGCGKSNLLEALRWVMGENRPTAMRGSGMEDVIFAGASTRPARNFAEVCLTIDNSERLAPTSFNDSDNLEIIRRITRDAGSAFKTNGKDVRARDVQMLFADASTGAHSPALVRQGQISELINAKPKARRRILEEAAGISGLYQRRHEAELKLKGAETNLARIDDVLDQLGAQLAQLTRQARQAARYREIGTELRQAEGMLLYRRWKEAEDARAKAEDALREAVTAAARAEHASREAAEIREESEAAVPPLREEEAIATALLQRVTVERTALSDEEARAIKAIETLSARIAQLSRDLERESTLNADAGSTIEVLQEEAEELRQAGEGHEDALDGALDRVEAATDTLAERESTHSELTEEAARLAARHQSAQRLLDETARAAARHAAEAEKARSDAEAAEASLDDLARQHDEAEQELTHATDLAGRAEETLTEAEAARSDAQAAEGEARTARAEAEGEWNTLDAEVRALAKLLDRERGDTAQLLDRVRVAPGFEAAVGAALSDDLKAPEADGGATGWTTLPQYDTPQPLPAGVVSLADYVDAPPVLARRLRQIGVVQNGDGPALQAQLQPGQRLVNRTGDLWRWDGYALAAEDGSSTAARRLQQANQLADLSAELERAEVAADRARAMHEANANRLAALTEADKQARAARRAADQKLAEASRTFSRTEAERNILAGKLETLTQAAARHAEEAETARENMAEAEQTKAELEDLDAARTRVEAARAEVETARSALMAARAAHDELKRMGEARDTRLARIAQDIAGWRKRLDSATSHIADLNERKDATEAELEQARLVPNEIATKKERLAEAIDTAEERRQAAADALAVGETRLREAIASERDRERDASSAREARARAEALRDSAAEALHTAAERIEEEMETTPQALLESLDMDPDAMPSVDKIDADVVRLRRQRDALGAVNLRAEEDARDVAEERDTLQADKDDLEEAIRKLRGGIASLNREGRERLLAAFEEVNTNFGMLFTHLFGGGEAKLVLVESDDPLEAGLEILCQPPGKKLSTLSLLSGGEQTLTALALIFAVFLANPAPICVLDEVDAPLDDANVTRFCDLLDEMTRQTDTRFLIITHHAVTMARMDRLFGVTMAEQGVSQLVSVDLHKAEQLVA